MFRYETFYYLWVKGFNTRKRDAQSFYDDFSICPPPPRATPVAHKFVWPQRAPKINPSRSESSSKLLTFSNLRGSSAHASGAWCHSHPSSPPLSGIFILTSVNDTSSPHARQHLCSSFHLTNPCAEPKGSQLTARYIKRNPLAIILQLDRYTWSYQLLADK